MGENYGALASPQHFGMANAPMAPRPELANKRGREKNDDGT
jgi:hypothetical protein